MKLRLVVCLILGGFITSSRAVELQPETNNAWEQFIAKLDAKVEQEALQPDSLLALDRSAVLRAKVRAGKIVVFPATGSGMISVPSGLIHDWIGYLFIPDVTAHQVLEKVRAFDRYTEFYKPSVLAAKTLKSGDVCSFSMLLRQKVMFVDAALDGQYDCAYFALPPSRWYSITTGTRLQEIRNYGRPDQQVFPPDKGDGFIWRIQDVAKYEEADGGVYIELEAVALSRTIPVALRWMVDGVVKRISRAALVTTLQQTLEANRKQE
jgi:hypothetical protein